MQIQIFATPFHRMFSLDNKSIQYPFAVVERVPVGEMLHPAPSPSTFPCCLPSIRSLVYYLCWGHSVPHPPRLGSCVPSIPSQGPSDLAGLPHRPYANEPYHRYYKERRWETSP